MLKKLLVSIIVIALISGAVVTTRANFNNERNRQDDRCDSCNKCNNCNQCQSCGCDSFDLKIDNSSYYNGFSSDGHLEKWDKSSWQLSDLPAKDSHGKPKLFFNFLDIKPGDLGEDTVSFHLSKGTAWLCADLDITANDDVTCTEPELKDDPTCSVPGKNKGELADSLNFIFWADDGDNVLEKGEKILIQGKASQVLGGKTYALADKNGNIWNNKTEPIESNKTYYLGKAWCFGNLEAKPVSQSIFNKPTKDPGVLCNGINASNAAQTDLLKGDVTFRAVQANNNKNFKCSRPG
jgi:hypothetical protein